MARRKKAGAISTGHVPQATNGGTLGFEAKVWAAADALRNNMHAAEYKHVVLGPIFLKYISDASRRSTWSRSPKRRKEPIPKTPTSTVPPASSGCQKWRAGPI